MLSGRDTDYNQSAAVIQESIEYDTSLTSLYDWMCSDSVVYSDRYYRPESKLFRKIGSVSMPPTLQEQLTCMLFQTTFLDQTDAEATIVCGLVPEIGRAYVAIDNKLFLWDYKTNRAMYERFQVSSDW